MKWSHVSAPSLKCKKMRLPANRSFHAPNYESRRVCNLLNNCKMRSLVGLYFSLVCETICPVPCRKGTKNVAKIRLFDKELFCQCRLPTEIPYIQPWVLPVMETDTSKCMDTRAECPSRVLLFQGVGAGGEGDVSLVGEVTEGLQYLCLGVGQAGYHFLQGAGRLCEQFAHRGGNLVETHR